MTQTTRARTARVPHFCDGCHWTPSLRGVPTIAPGHRYLIHTAFPGGLGDEINQSDRPYTNKECVACACERDETSGLLVAGACSTFCCGDVPCARPHLHDGDHSCRRCPSTRPIGEPLVASSGPRGARSSGPGYGVDRSGQLDRDDRWRVA